MQGVGGVQQPLVFDEFARVKLVGGAVGECRVQRAYGVGKAGFKRLIARVLQVVAVGGGLQTQFLAFWVDEALRVLHERAEGDDAVLFVEVELGARRGFVVAFRRGFDVRAFDGVALTERGKRQFLEFGGVLRGDFGLWVGAKPGDVVGNLRVGDGVEGVLVVDEERGDAQLFVGQRVVFVAKAQAGVDLVEVAVAGEFKVEADPVAGIEGDGGEVAARVAVAGVVGVNGAGELPADVGKFAYDGDDGSRLGL